jgi:hypothetical protein
MYPSVTRVSVSDGYVLEVRFDNGEQGTLDLSDLLDFGVFQKLRDPDAFRRVRVAFDTIEWEAGVDLDPEFVYQRFKKTGDEQQIVPSAVRTD